MQTWQPHAKKALKHKLCHLRSAS